MLLRAIILVLIIMLLAWLAGRALRLRRRR